MNKKIITRILAVVIVVMALLAAIAYFYYDAAGKPNMALYCVLAGGVIVLNFIVALYLVNKNFKDKK